MKNKEIRRMIQMVRRAIAGHRVMIVGRHLPHAHLEIGEGMLFCRTHSPSGLMSTLIDTIWFVDDVPEESQQLCIEKTQLYRDSLILYGVEDG